ncbi:MAG: uridine kinase [Pseudomonadota bacterium]
MSRCFIAIAGPSGSGKSLFSQTLLSELRAAAPAVRVALIKEDSYYRDQSLKTLEEREKVNYDHPDALEHELLSEHLMQLRDGQGVDVPVYDYTVHTRATEVERVEPAEVIIVEGILLLASEALRGNFDMRFYMDTALDICLLRRLDRDMRERGRSLDSVVTQYQDTVRPMYYRYIRPSAEYADMVITGGGKNRVALDVVRSVLLDRASESRS